MHHFFYIIPIYVNGVIHGMLYIYYLSWIAQLWHLLLLILNLVERWLYF